MTKISFIHSCMLLSSSFIDFSFFLVFSTISVHVLYKSVISDSLLYDRTTLVHGFRCVLKLRESISRVNL